MNIKAKIKKSSKLQENLDEFIIDLHCKMASDINNEGIEGQIKWLNDIGITDDAIIETIK